MDETTRVDLAGSTTTERPLLAVRRVRREVAPIVLEMRGITKTFPGVKALQDVSMRVHRAEVVALLSENGAGKSTLVNVLSGVFPAYDGTIELDGRPVSIAIWLGEPISRCGRRRLGGRLAGSRPGARGR